MFQLCFLVKILMVQSLQVVYYVSVQMPQVSMPRTIILCPSPTPFKNYFKLSRLQARIGMDVFAYCFWLELFFFLLFLNLLCSLLLQVHFRVLESSCFVLWLSHLLFHDLHLCTSYYFRHNFQSEHHGFQLGVAQVEQLDKRAEIATAVVHY